MPDSLMQRLGLGSEPFAADNQAPFLSTPELQQRQALLTHLIEHASRPVLVIGETGSGKTRFLRRFQDTAPRGLAVACWTATAEAGLRDLLPELIQAFGIDPGDQTLRGLAQTVRAQLDDGAAGGRLAVLCVDDADRLPRETLLQVLALGAGHGQGLRLVLAGEAELEAQAMRALRDAEPAWLARLDMPQLTATQVADYLNLCLASAGWSGDSPFDTRTCTVLQQRSGGNPGRLGRVATEYLSGIEPVDEGGGSGLARLANLPWRWLLPASAGSVLLALVLAWLLWPEPDSPAPDAVPTFELPRPLDPQRDLAEGPSPASGDVAVPPAARLPAPAPERPRQASPPPRPPATPAQDTPDPLIPLGGTATGPDTGRSAAPAPPADPRAATRPRPRPRPADITGRAAAAPQVSTASRAGERLPRPRPPPVPRPAQQLAAPRPPAPVTAPAAPVPAPRPPAVAGEVRPVAPPPAPSAPAQAPGGAPVRTATAATGYGLQLGAFGDAASAFDYIARQGLADRARVYAIDAHGGGTLYAVLLGPFASREDATRAVSDLPLRLRVAGPWPRSLEELRAVPAPR